MESVIRDVKSLELEERRVYESALGHALHEDQRVLVAILDPAAELDESIRRQARDDLHDLSRQATEHRQRLGVSVEEADRVLDEAIRAVRSRNTA
jgi:hypothetical protein